MANSNEGSLNALKPNDNSASKVGSVPVITMQEHMTIMRELIQSLVQKLSAESKNLPLPRFNPETAGSDPATWCAAVNLIMEKNPLQCTVLFSALSRALEGSAVHWLTQVLSGEDITWPIFKELFTARFGGKETATSALMKIFNEQQLKDETTGAFGIRLRSLLKTRWENLTMAEVINASVLFRLISQDQRIERMAFTSDIKPEDQFLSEMRVFSYAKKRSAPSSDNSPAGPEAKRHKPSDSRVKCLYCGTLGHRIAKCHKGIIIEKKKNIQNSEGNRSTASSKVSCFKCHEEGHVAPNLEAPTGRLSHMGELFPFYFDSGAECSLIKEFVAVKFSGKRMTDMLYVLMVLHGSNVLVDNYLKYDRMIGREILSKGFNTGFPRTRVNTGQLEIQLIDPNVIVQRNPYRLSEEERRIVRERISELIKAKIIRYSNSPFASPMLLVEKKDGLDRLCVDFRELNKNMVADRYPPPLIGSIARLQKARYFISLGMASGFHQISIHPNSTEYTAFVTTNI
ncbi:uncharacterized protein [Bombus fervidus]|uniref:uncharacterized protein n=1 Tax=Bombus fervidus TaxID=203811 RepID=UPI003D18D1C5